MDDALAMRCSFFVLDVERATGLHMPEQYRPSDWEHNQYAVELYLRRAAEMHPWRVSNAESADVVFAAANFSQWCVAGRTGLRRKLWTAIFHAPANATPVLPKVAAPVFVARQYDGACGGPAEGGKALPANLILLQEEVDAPAQRLAGASSASSERAGELQRRLVSPFVVSRPDWLVGDGTPPPSVTLAWHERKLLFFAGHVPKPYIRDTRYVLWRQLRNDHRATVLSTTLLCTVGAYSEVCRRSDAFLQAQNVSYFSSFCAAACAPAATPGKGMYKGVARVACLTARREVTPALLPALRRELKTRCKNGCERVLCLYTHASAPMPLHP